MIYDVHAHLDLIEDLDKIILNAKKNNIKKIISNSTNLNSLKKIIKIKEKYTEIIKIAAGYYPEENLTLNKYEEFEKFIKENKTLISAIGEIGMDGTEKLDFKFQKKIFIKQLILARELNLPVIIHTRKAEKEVFEILENYLDLNIILHCFSGKLKLVEEGIKKGFYFSIPANITRSEHFQKMVEMLPKNKILTETDSPYLSPIKDAKNEPANIVKTIDKISKIWKISKKEVEGQIEKNYLQIFQK